MRCCERRALEWHGSSATSEGVELRARAAECEVDSRIGNPAHSRLSAKNQLGNMFHGLLECLPRKPPRTNAWFAEPTAAQLPWPHRIGVQCPSAGGGHGRSHSGASRVAGRITADSVSLVRMRTPQDVFSGARHHKADCIRPGCRGRVGSVPSDTAFRLQRCFQNASDAFWAQIGCSGGPA